MAILKNLLVNGASRFINTAYFQDVSIGGTASLASLSLSGALTVEGTTTLKGATTINNTMVVNGSINTKEGVELYHSTPYIDFHFGNSSTDYTSRIIESVSGTLKVQNNLTVANKLSAPEIVATNISTENLRWAKLEEITVADLGGTFIVAPTIFFTEGATSVHINNISGKTVTMTITCDAITSDTLGGHTWSEYSKVKLSGMIGGCVLGSSDGYLSAKLNTTAKTANVIATIENAALLSSGTTYSGANVKNLAMMMYAVGNGSQTNTNKVGMVLTSYGDNYRSYLDIYGGTSNQSVARVGNLGGLTFNGETLENQWGILTSNGYFDGTIISNEGHIGGWTIGVDKLYNGTDSMTSTAVGTYIGAGSSAANSGIRNYASATQYVNITGGKITALGADIRGEITATSGKIGKYSITGSYLLTYQNPNNQTSATCTGFGGQQAFWAGNDLSNNAPFRVSYSGELVATSATITGEVTATSGTIGGVTANSSYGLYTNSKTSATSTNTGFLISKDGAIYLGAYNSTNKACPFQVTSAGALTATSGKIGGWTIGTSSLYNTTNSMTSTGVGLYLGTDGIRNYASATKYVNITGGKITALGVDVSGKITATEGAIGGFDITSTAIKTKNVAVTSNADNSISLSSADFTRTINSTPREGLRFAIGDKFGVTGDGTIYAGSANISGTLSAGANSTIGPWTVSKTSIYKGSNSIDSTSSTAAYFGNDGLSIGGLVKIDARSSAATTISLGNTSSSNISISSSGLMINDNGTSMATFNSDGIEMRGTDEQLLLDINTTGDPVTQSDSIVFSIQPIEVDSTHIFKLNEDINENLRNVIGNANVIVTFINGQEPSVLDTFTFNLNSDYNKNMGSGFTFNYKSKVSTFDDPYFSITCSGIVYGSECELVIDISWNYKQYPYNYTFGTRSKYGVRGIGSTIIGKNLENTNDNALVVGQYNKNGNYLFAVGNGDSDSNRSNAFTVDNYGVVGFSGVAMFGDPGGTFYVTSHTVVNNASVASQGYKDGTITIEKSGYYPLCVAGYNSNTRYLTPVRFYLSDQQSGSGSLHYMIFNPTSSARTGTCTMWVMWVKTT